MVCQNPLCVFSLLFQFFINYILGNSVLRRRIHLTGLPQLVLTMDGELLLKDLPPARALLDQSPD